MCATPASDSSGMMNARLLAWIYGALACGGELDGARLLVHPAV